jgi:hypothetical protein
MAKKKKKSTTPLEYLETSELLEELSRRFYKTVFIGLRDPAVGGGMEMIIEYPALSCGDAVLLLKEAEQNVEMSWMMQTFGNSNASEDDPTEEVG